MGLSLFAVLFILSIAEQRAEAKTNTYSQPIQGKTLSCRVEVSPIHPFETSCNSGIFQATLSLNVINTGNNSIASPWNLTISNPSYQNALNAFNSIQAEGVRVDGSVKLLVASSQMELLPRSANQVAVGVTVETRISNDTLPYTVSLNGNLCQLVFKGQDGTVAIAQPHLTTFEGQILGADGDPVDIKGAAWFGFAGGPTMVDGLFQPDGVELPDALSMDFGTVVHRMQLLGLNAIRLPFSFRDIYTRSPLNYTKRCFHASETKVLYSVTPSDVALALNLLSDDPVAPTPAPAPAPLNAIQAAPAPKSKLFAPAPGPSYFNNTLNITAEDPGDSICNEYLPMTSTLERFLYVIDHFTKNGFYVLLSYQLNSEPTFRETSTQVVQSWIWLMKEVAKLPASRSRVLVDAFNEPDAFNIRWEHNVANNTVGLADMYLAVYDALHTIDPTALFLFQGCGQGPLVGNWGDGLSTDAAVLKANPSVSDPTPFFKALLKKPYLSQMVAAPHIYPPSVSGKEVNTSGATGLWVNMTRNFGYLNKEGFCDGDVCHVFPIIIGEIGSRLESIEDITAMYDMAEYFNNIGNAQDGRHQRIGSWFWWAWNANSGDTGGLVGPNWTDVSWLKVNFLRYVGLRSWYEPQEVEILTVPSKDGSFLITANVSAGIQRPRPKFLCPNLAADNVYTCEDQKSFGKCNADWMLAGGYCNDTCSRCPGFVYDEFGNASPAPASTNSTAAAPSLAAATQPSSSNAGSVLAPTDSSPQDIFRAPPPTSETPSELAHSPAIAPGIATAVNQSSTLLSVASIGTATKPEAGLEAVAEASVALPGRRLRALSDDAVAPRNGGMEDITKEGSGSLEKSRGGFGRGLQGLEPILTSSWDSGFAMGQSSLVDYGVVSGLGGKPELCQILVTVGHPWKASGGPDGFLNMVSLQINYTGSGILQSPWALTLQNPSYMTVADAWNWIITSASNGFISGIAQSRSMDLSPLPSSTTAMGFIVLSQNISSFIPSSAALEGMNCLIKHTSTQSTCSRETAS